MKTDLSKPITVRFSHPKNTKENKKINFVDNCVSIPRFVKWNDFNDAVQRMANSPKLDSVILEIDSEFRDQTSSTYQQDMRHLNVKLKKLSDVLGAKEKPVLEEFESKWYILNADYNLKSKPYAPNDSEVMAKFESFEPDEWQKHQSDIWKTFEVTNGLFEPKNERDLHFKIPKHISSLTSESRGLSENDLNGFFSWKPNVPISPSVVGDDMVGMPCVKARHYDMTLSQTTTTADGNLISTQMNIQPIGLKTGGMSGIMIPMKNADGVTPKYQVAADVSAINVRLKMRSPEGESINGQEYRKRGNFRKGTKDVYFLDASDRSQTLEIVDVLYDTVTFKDSKGMFKAQVKDDIKQTLIDRGYVIPELAATIKVEPTSKYIWPSLGDMVGTKDTSMIVTPSKAGFIQAREPKNGANDYVLLVVEGALKGVIVSKLLDEVDSSGQSFGDRIAKNRGVIIAQVAGTNASYQESIKPIYDKYPIAGSYVAMDADGRTNLRVAEGVHSAYKILSEKSPVKILSWDPEHKGLDDALIAIKNGKLNVSDLDLHFGKPETLFPLSQATPPNPRLLNGGYTYGNNSNEQSKNYGPAEWMLEYEDDVKQTNEAIIESQLDTQASLIANEIKEKLSDVSVSGVSESEMIEKILTKVVEEVSAMPKESNELSL